MIGIAILLLTAVFTNIPSPPPPAPEPFFGANQVEHRDIVSLSITPNAPGKTHSKWHLQRRMAKQSLIFNL